jgi:hypothetical protein
MPSLALSRTDALRETNQRLRHWLDCMITRRGQLTAATPDRITALLSELSRAGAELRAQPIPATGTDPELDRELELYRRHVERLREILPSIHSQLLVERARLEAQRARVLSAAEWARASRQTL